MKKLKNHYNQVKDDFAKNGIELPQNTGGKDLYRRELDCLLINSLVAKQREECPEEAYDSVRGVFLKEVNYTQHQDLEKKIIYKFL